MSYAVKIGTNEVWWIDEEDTPDGCVRYDSALPVNAVWDDSIQTIREMTAEELARASIAPVSAAQFRLALLDLGLLDEVEAFVAASGRDIQLNWEYRQEFARDHPLVVFGAMALGKTPEEMDAIFVLAATK